MRQSPFLQEHFPDFVKRFDPMTGAAPSSVESFAYWSKEQLVRDHPGSQLYLAYPNRSDLDVLSGLWGGLVRMVLGRRLKAEAPGVLETLRARLETGPPSAQK